MLELKNIKKSFDGVTVLNNVDFAIEDGAIVSILGSSGSGKTTLLNTILGIIQPDGGKILHNGVDITAVPMEDRGFNIVFQDYALFPNLNLTIISYMVCVTNPMSLLRKKFRTSLSGLA